MNWPVVVGGVLVNPGDIICGDDDGVVLVRAQEAESVGQKARERE